MLFSSHKINHNSPCSKNLKENYNFFKYLPRAVPLFWYVLCSAIFLTILYNSTLIYFLIDNAQQPNILFTLKMVFLAFIINFLIVSLFPFKKLLKTWLILLIIISAFSSYFMQSYGVLIDKNMLQNVLETDWNETRGLISSGMFLHLVLFLLIPAIVTIKLNIKWPSTGVQFTSWAGMLVIGFVLLFGLLHFNYKEMSSFFRNHREVKHLAVPLNAISASISVANKLLATSIPQQFNHVAADARLNPHPLKNKPNLFVMIVGETARADHFALNGYVRNTTPQLAALAMKYPANFINFNNVFSCGTATAVSLPCMFSYLPRNNYDENLAKNSDNLLDALQYAGVNLFWLDNNSGCKGMCNRIPTEKIICSESECNDLHLLDALKDKIQTSQLTKDTFVVLHQLGSHGPEYFKRSKTSQKLFFPECQTNQLQKCTTQEIINAYDNSIVATDELVAKTILWLKEYDSQYNVGLIYVSDHGESLGENGIFLHGLPYRFAPDSQKHVPMLVWMSDSFVQQNDISLEKFKSNSNKTISHDVLFSLILNLLNVNTSSVVPESKNFIK